MNYIKLTVKIEDNEECFIFKDIPLLKVGKKVAHLTHLTKAFALLQKGKLTEETTVNEERKLLRELKELGVKPDYSVMFLIDTYIYKNNLPRVICGDFYEVEI